MFINFCSVTVRTKKNYIFRSTGNNLQIQTVRCSLSKEKNFPPNFQDGPISRSRTFLQGKAFSFLTRHSEMIVICLSSSVRHYETNDKLAPKNSMITCQYSVSHSKRFEEIVTGRWTTEDVPKQTKAKSEEYRVKLGRLRCGLTGRSYSIVTIAHSLNRTTIWLRLHRRQWP